MKTPMQSTKFLMAGSVCLMLGACASTNTQDLMATSEARIAATPKAEAQKTITSFSQSLQCMDDLFVRYQVSDLRLGAQNILDHTSDIQTATKDMMITAMSTMSRKSRAVRFVVLGNDLYDITQFHTYHANQDFKSPDFFIRIGAPQVDKAAITDRMGIGLRFGHDASGEYSKDRMVSVVSLDMNLGSVKTLEIVPGMSSNNSIAITRRGEGTDIAGSVKKLGALFQIGLDRSEGLHHSVRTLVELGAIELMGRLTRVPYWECLDVPSTNPLVQNQIRDWYLALDDDERRIFVQSKLDALSYYRGPVDGKNYPNLQTAIALFKKDNGLRADSQIDLDLYYRLITDAAPIKQAYLPLLTQKIKQGFLAAQPYDPALPEGELEQPQTKPQHLGLERDGISPLLMTLDTERGVRPVFKAGESLNVRVKTTTDAHVYCYYQQADDTIFKIFPNRFSPNAKVAGGKDVRIPGTNSFELRLDQHDAVESVMCMASIEELDKKLPPELGQQSLEPLPLKKLESVYHYYKQAASVLPLKHTLTVRIN
ncbi:MAG: DUF4384 domain-containing protein [Thiotrichales bacterium]